MALGDFQFVGNSNVCPICHHLRDINSRKVHDLDYDLLISPRSNVNMLIERPHVTLYVLAIAMFALSVTAGNILAIEMPMIMALPFTMGQGHM